MKRPVLTIIVVLGMSLTALAQSRGDDISRLINAFLDEQDPDRVGVSACREVNELQKLVLDLKSAFLEESGQEAVEALTQISAQADTALARLKDAMEVAGEGVVSGGPFRVLIAHDMKDFSVVPKRVLLDAMAIALASVSFLASNIAAGERSFEEIGSIEDSSAAVAVACSAYLGLKVGLQDFFN